MRLFNINQLFVKASDFLKIYTEDSFVLNIQKKLSENKILQIEGLTGSLDAVMVASTFLNKPQTILAILSDKEEEPGLCWVVM